MKDALIILAAFVALLASSCTDAPKRPNFLFCIADDASYPHMGAYGTKWVTTPGFDRVAQEGILFTNAYTPNAKCAPSRACILTGRNSWQLKAAANHQPFFPPEFKTYPEALAENGYFVGKTAKGWAPGVANDVNGNKRELAGAPFDERTADPPASGISKIDYAANFADFIAARPADTPWCFWYGALEPHRRYEYGSGVAKGGKKLEDIEKVFEFWPDNEVTRNDLLDYAFEIEHFDSHLVKMLELLEMEGELGNTVVFVTADHGMPFPRVKGQEYEYSNHVPLAIMWKDGITNPGRVAADYVSFIDLAPTFVELAGLDWSAIGLAPSPGRSLTDIFSAPASGRTNPERGHVLIGKERHDIGRPHDWGYPIRGIVKDGMLYVHNYEPSRWPAGNPETGYPNTDASPTKTEVLKSRTATPPRPYWQLSFGKRPEEELFDVKNDPECMTNLADDPEYAERKEALRQQLMAELTAQQDPRALGNGSVFENYPVAFERLRNFHERFTKGEIPQAGWINETDIEKEPLE